MDGDFFYDWKKKILYKTLRRTKIKEEVFNNCDFLTSVNLSNNTTYIGKKAFQNCLGLSTLTLGNNITYFGEYAFENCSKLTTINYPNSLTTVAKGLFKNTGLTSFDFSNIQDKFPIPER